MVVVVIGAGVVGLACAAMLSQRGHSVMLLERNTRFGEEISARNSQVIHAGLYYEPGSLKATLCTAGRDRLYARCRRYGIPFRQCGKLLVATNAEEIVKMEQLFARGQKNGAGPLEILDATQIRQLEPRVRAVAAVMSPLSGIVDTHALMLNYLAEAEKYGAHLVTNTKVMNLTLHNGTWHITTQDANGEKYVLEADCVINAAGLGAERIAQLAGLNVEALRLKLHPCKGDYFAVAPSLGKLTDHLIYPLPVHAGLGIHITFDLGGRFILGPDTTYVNELQYRVDSSKAEVFAAAVARYFPDIRAEDLSADYAGIRPKLQGPTDSVRDFVIEECTPHNAAGFINLIGIESPGITASEAIALRVAEFVA